MITICFTYYRSLTLANLSAALYSVRRQDFSRVEEIVIVDNNTDDLKQDIQTAIDEQGFLVPVRLLSFKHGDPNKTHSWSTNVVVAHASAPWIFFTRADYLLEFDAVERFAAEATDDRFIVGGYYDIGANVYDCDRYPWREQGPSTLRALGREYDHVLIDSGVWMTTKKAFDQVGGLDESLSAWGHAQTHFQYRLHLAGIQFVRIPRVLFYHPAHGYETPRDHGIASRQIQDLGLNVADMWTRYEGANNPYK